MVTVDGYGVDIGGSGIKGAPVDLDEGGFAQDRWKVATPQPATVQAVAAAVQEVVAHHGWTGPLGCTFPAVVQHGIARSAANVDSSWVGADIAAEIGKTTGLHVAAMNDADAAGIAEMTYGAGKGRDGVVVVLTFGTGIGSAVFTDGRLLPNTELGHLQLDGHPDIEKHAAASAKDREGLKWREWARERVSPYLQHVESLLWPDLFILGGGVSRKAEKWLDELDCRTECVSAQLENDAGIVGAALVAAREAEHGSSAQARSGT